MAAVSGMLGVVGLTVLMIAAFDLVITTVAVSAGKGPSRPRWPGRSGRPSWDSIVAPTAGRTALGLPPSCTTWTAYIEPGDEHVPTPAITELREPGLPLPDDHTLSDAFTHLETRRRLLHGFLQHMGWHWEDLADGRRAVPEHAPSHAPTAHDPGT